MLKSQLEFVKKTLQLTTIPGGLVCVADVCTSTRFALSHQIYLMVDDSTVAPKIHNISPDHLVISNNQSSPGYTVLNYLCSVQ